MTKPQKIEGGWEERLLDLFTEDENHHLHLIDGSYSLESFISDLLASERQRCVAETIQSVLACINKWVVNDKEDLDDLRETIKKLK
jgi:hypothetical protein